MGARRKRNSAQRLCNGAVYFNTLVIMFNSHCWAISVKQINLTRVLMIFFKRELHHSRGVSSTLTRHFYLKGPMNEHIHTVMEFTKVKYFNSNQLRLLPISAAISPHFGWCGMATSILGVGSGKPIEDAFLYIWWEM